MVTVRHEVKGDGDGNSEDKGVIGRTTRIGRPGARAAATRSGETTPAVGHGWCVRLCACVRVCVCVCVYARALRAHC